MSDTPFQCVVMFADIAGSTSLYERLGDLQARTAIEKALTLITSIVERHGGVIIKTIGDEVMCRLPDPKQGAAAAIEIQNAMESSSFLPDTSLAVRIGLHFGNVLLEEDGDLFGDAVNVAARVASSTKADQILITGEVFQALSPEQRSQSRFVETTIVKGKQLPIELYEIIWQQQEDVTCLIQADALQARPGALNFNFQNQFFQLDDHQLRYTMGRGNNNDLIIDDAMVSRAHARLEFRKGNVYLVDQSTNGTHIRNQQGNLLFLRREEMMLLGAGVIRLGRQIEDSANDLIRFFPSE